MAPSHTASPSHQQSGTQVRPLSGLILSVGFWACFVAAAVLFAAVSLSIRVVEFEHLRREQTDRQSELLTLQQEVTHLQRVASSLARDDRLRDVIARKELRDTEATGVSVPLTGRLQHDPRSAPADPVDVTYQEPLYLPLLESIADSPQRRLQWSLIAAGLLFLGFVFLHENAGCRAVGRLLLKPFDWLGRRYTQARRSGGEP